MQSSAMQKKLQPRSPASSLSAINMNTLLSSAGTVKSPTSRMVSRMIQQSADSEEDDSRHRRPALQALSVDEEDDDASQETYSVVTNYRDDEELELLRNLDGHDNYRSRSAPRKQMSVDVSHHSNSSVNSRHTNNNSVISVAAPLGSHAKGGTFSRSPARGRNADNYADEHANEFKYLMFKNTDSGNYVRELISPRADKRSSSTGRLRDSSAERRRGGHVSSSSSISTATGAFSSNSVNNGPSNRLRNTESHHPPHSVFSFSNMIEDLEPSHRNMSPPTGRRFAP
jgi:hypothetical protein